MHPSRLPAKRYVSPISPDERMATMLLSNLRRMAKIGMGCPVSEADLAWLEAERDRLKSIGALAAHNKPVEAVDYGIQ